MSTTSLTDNLPTPFEPLKRQLLAAAEALADNTQPLAAILGGLVNDVERAGREPLEILPVCHHSPSSALHMVRRLAGHRATAYHLLGVLRGPTPRTRMGSPSASYPSRPRRSRGTSDAFPSSWFPLNTASAR